VSEKESTAVKQLAAIRERQEKLKAEQAEIAKQLQAAQQARAKELAADAGGLCDKVFKSIFTGQLSKDIEALREISVELMNLDGRSFQVLTADENASIRFFGKFVFEPLNNGRGLADILPKAWAHSDNTYRTP
jgi:hypothetical protein